MGLQASNSDLHISAIEAHLTSLYLSSSSVTTEVRVAPTSYLEIFEPWGTVDGNVKWRSHCGK